MKWSGTRFGFPLETMLMLTIALFIAGFLCFALFFKAVDFFEKI